MSNFLNVRGAVRALTGFLLAGGALTGSLISAPGQAAIASRTEPPQIKVSDKVLDEYVGRYRLGSNFFITVTRDGEHLYAQADGQQPFELIPETEREFVAKAPAIRVTFVTNERGSATTFVLHRGEESRAARRVLSSEDIKRRCAQIDSMVAEDFAKHPVGSVTVGVVLGNELIWTKSYGEADMDNHLSADKDTVYRIGSITKMFTAVMLEQLVDAGKVHFTDPVDKYFPEIDTVQAKYPWAPPVTFFELATHTRGWGASRTIRRFM